MNFIRASSAFTVRLSNRMALILNSCALPRQCLLCAGNSRRALCDACYAQLPWLPRAHCPQCALPTTNGALCGGCLQHPPRFDRVIAACVYAYPLAELIRSYKYQGMLALAPLLAQTLATKTDAAVDLLVPLPLSRERLRARDQPRRRDSAGRARLSARPRQHAASVAAMERAQEKHSRGLRV